MLIEDRLNYNDGLIERKQVNETEKINLTNRADIIAQIDDIIKQRYKSFENNKIDIDKKPILKRITYIVMPVWELENLAEEFQDKI